MIPMVFAEVRVTSVADTPVLLLREAQGARYVGVWISAAGGRAILSARGGSTDDHPGTHDLMVEALAVLDAVVESVRITAFSDGVYSSELVISGTTVPCRVSDGVALALRCGAPILAAAELLDAVGITAGAEGPAAHLVTGTDDQLEQFRAFLEPIDPDDFHDDIGKG